LHRQWERHHLALHTFDSGYVHSTTPWNGQWTWTVAKKKKNEPNGCPATKQTWVGPFAFHMRVPGRHLSRVRSSPYWKRRTGRRGTGRLKIRLEGATYQWQWSSPTRRIPGFRPTKARVQFGWRYHAILFSISENQLWIGESNRWENPGSIYSIIKNPCSKPIPIPIHRSKRLVSKDPSYWCGPGSDLWHFLSLVRKKEWKEIL